MKSTRQFSCEIKLQQHLEKQRDLSLNRIKKYFDSGKEMDRLQSEGKIRFYKIINKKVI